VPAHYGIYRNPGLTTEDRQASDPAEIIETWWD